MTHQEKKGGTQLPHAHSASQRQSFRCGVATDALEHTTTNVRTKYTTAVPAWVALDDLELVKGEANAALAAKFEGHVVRTDPQRGLTMADAELAVKLLRAQVPENHNDRLYSL
eukprot:TRINITY_DN15363_c0_g1_i2.p1 TRINITY_DN15363_c0_g1~~TRINITY_DN15363_c0_g1_i2.p1  ORF type:complete len:113 (+),score=18.85 TRINITY_DN15363_c0_g1_i2:138-476(+)